MPTSLESAVATYLRCGNPAQRTREDYSTTLRKWERWGECVSLGELGRTEIREFLDWVYTDAASRDGRNPGRTANKVRSHLRAVMSWAWEQDLVNSLPRFPKVKPQRDVAGRHYLTRAEINAMYFATHEMKNPRGWCELFPVGRYWRAALVIFVNYGLDTGTVWKTAPFHEPILWRHVSWKSRSPDRELKETSRWGWLFYRRVKTGKAFYRPMNRTVHEHFRSILPDEPDSDSPVFRGGSTRPNRRFRELCQLAEIGPKSDPENGKDRPTAANDERGVRQTGEGSGGIKSDVPGLLVASDGTGSGRAFEQRVELTHQTGIVPSSERPGHLRFLSVAVGQQAESFSLAD